MVVIALCVWMASGLLFKQPEAIAEEQDTEDTLMVVEAQTLELETMNREVTLQGSLEPVRHLLIKAETSGNVQEHAIEKGSRVIQGATLLTLDRGGRDNQLAEAAARVRSARSEQAAAKSLRQQRLQSQVQLEQADAALESALAQLATIELDIERTTITAPFAGVVNDLPIDPGELANRGDIVAELVDDSQFVVTARASQQSLASLALGQPLTVKLITGENLSGKLTYISSIADPQTRSFAIEALIDNVAGATAAGVSASISIPVEQVEATFLSPSAISLGDDGELGVKAVDDNGEVFYLPVAVVSTSLDGAWVTGIPAGTRVITLGQGFVNVGERVEARTAEITGTR